MEARLGCPERHLGGYCMLLNGLGRFQNALGTFQEAPEKFGKFGWGGRGRPRTRVGRAVRAGPPKLKEKHQKTKLELECLVFGKYKGFGLRCLVFNTHTHRRARRGGG